MISFFAYEKVAFVLVLFGTVEVSRVTVLTKPIMWLSELDNVLAFLPPRQLQVFLFTM